MSAWTSHLRRARWLVLAPALMAVLLLSAPARADDEEPPEGDPESPTPNIDAINLEAMSGEVDTSDAKWTPIEKTLVDAMATADTKAVLKVIAGRDQFLAIALRPKTALLLHRETIKNLRALRNESISFTDLLLQRNLATADLYDREKVKKPLMEAASTFGRLAGPLLKMIGGDRPDFPAFKAAVEALKKVDATTPVAVDEWKEILLPALTLGNSLGDETLTAWAYAEIDRVAKAHADDPQVKRILQLVDLEKGIRLARTKPGEAAFYLTRALNALGVKGALATNDETLVSRYNAAITVARLAGISVSADYCVRTLSTLRLTCEVPKAVGWESKECNGDTELDLERAGRGGVSLVVAIYESDANYTADNGKVLDGDSLGMIMKDHVRTTKAGMSKVARELPSAGKLSKTIVAKKSWQIEGQSRDGKPVRVREWGIKAGGGSERFLIFRLEENDTPDKDPEVARVLDSLAEKVADKPAK